MPKKASTPTKTKRKKHPDPTYLPYSRHRNGYRPSGYRRTGYRTKFHSKEVEPSKRRIIICCDGTWQSSTDLDPDHAVPSNVTRLSRIIARAGADRDQNHWQQIIYYDGGVGTGKITPLTRYLQGKRELYFRVLFGTISTVILPQ